MIYNISGFSILLFGIYDAKIINTRPDFYFINAIFLLFETIGIIFSLTFEVMAAKIIHKSTIFNRNFINPLWLFIVQHVVSQVGRIILIMYQYDIIRITGNTYYDFPLLILSSYRFYVYCAAVVLLSNMLFERALAIFFIRDYEWKQRSWIIWALHTNSIGVQSFSVFMYTFMACYYDGLIFKIMYPYMIVWISNALWAFLFISHLNKRFLAFILKTFDLNKYTLSRRFQLEENVKALSLLRKIFILHCVFCLMGMNVFAFPHLIFEMGTPEMELCMSALEVTQGIYGITMNTMMIYMVPSWRKKLKSYRIMWVRDEPKTKSPTIEQRQMSATEEANVYFMELGKMWA